MGRKTKDLSLFDEITQNIRHSADLINALGNRLHSRELKIRLKMVHDNLINEIYRIALLRDFTTDLEGMKILIQKQDRVEPATEAEIWRAFIAQWENKNRRYKEEDLWKIPEDPKSPTTSTPAE